MRKLVVYWCPRCEAQSTSMHHLCKMGPPMFPQMDEYTTCETIAVVPKDEIEPLRTALEWYGDPKNYDVSGPLEGGAWGSAPRHILSDGGKRAREVL